VGNGLGCTGAMRALKKSKGAQEAAKEPCS